MDYSQNIKEEIIKILYFYDQLKILKLYLAVFQTEFVSPSCIITQNEIKHFK